MYINSLHISNFSLTNISASKTHKKTKQANKKKLSWKKATTGWVEFSLVRCEGFKLISLQLLTSDQMVAITSASWYLCAVERTQSKMQKAPSITEMGS